MRESDIELIWNMLIGMAAGSIAWPYGETFWQSLCITIIAVTFTTKLSILFECLKYRLTRMPMPFDVNIDHIKVTIDKWPV